MLCALKSLRKRFSVPYLRVETSTPRWITPGVKRRLVPRYNAVRIAMRPGVLVIRDEDRGSDMLFELRVADVPAWSTRTLTHAQWLLSQTWVRAKLALVDARAVADDRPTRIGLLAALSNELSLPTLIIGADDAESRTFHGVVAILPADATAKNIVALVQRLLSDGVR